MSRLFHPLSVSAQIAFATAGAVAAIITLNRDGFRLHAQPGQIPAIIVLGLVAVFIHELGHALVTVHYGRHVRIAGVRLHLGLPAFYVESIDALLLTRRQRLLQAAAGPWAEWMATSVAAFVFLALPADGATAAVLHRFVVVNTIAIATNLLPFVGLDGSLILADLIHEPDLPFRTISGPSAAGSPMWLTIYRISNGIVAVALLAMAGFFWWQLFGDSAATLWAYGPVGIAAVAAIGIVLTRQVTRIATPAAVHVAHVMSQIWVTVKFRSERKWRVEAINAFRALPNMAGLDAADLGVIAGCLERSRRSHSKRSSQHGHIYVQRLPRRTRRSSPSRQGDVINANDAGSLPVRSQTVFLNTNWALSRSQRTLGQTPVAAVAGVQPYGSSTSSRTSANDTVPA